MLPKIVKNSQYLEEHHYSLYNRSGKAIPVTSSNLKQVYNNPYQYSIRQSSGCDNALGAVVFRFSNSMECIFTIPLRNNYLAKANGL